MAEPYEVSVPVAWRRRMSDQLNLAAEVQFTAHLEVPIREMFATQWPLLGQLPGRPDERMITGTLLDGMVVFVVIAKLVAPTRIELIEFQAGTLLDDDTY